MEWKNTLNRTPLFLMTFALEWKLSAGSKTEELLLHELHKKLDTFNA